MPLSLPDSLRAASDSLKATITESDSLATQLAASDSLSFWQKFWETFVDPSQWTLVNVIATLAALFTIIGGLYLFIRWLKKGAAESSPVVVEKSENSLIVSGGVVKSTLNVYLSPPGKPTLNNEEFERMLNEYLRWVSNAYTKARLYGLESLRTGGAPVRKLSEVFVPVKLRRFQSLDREAKEKIGAHARDDTAANRSYLEWVEKKRGEGEEVGLKNLLNTAQRLAIVGGAGCGKSTVLAYLAASLANAATAGNLQLPFALPDRKKLLIPLLIPLRYYREYVSLSELSPQDRLRSPQTGKLAAFISWYLKRRSPGLERCEDFFERLLLGGGCLLMLDGLDEVVSRDERGRVRQEVEDIANDMYPGNLVVVTAREAGYQENAVFGDDFTRLDVQRLEDSQIEALVHNWCVQLYPGEEEVRIQELMDSIREINSLRRGRDLPPLISTPLMTTMVVSVKWGETELPRERARLYEAVVKVILQAQYLDDDDQTRELVNWGGAWEEQREWLSYLALEMHRGGQNGAAIPEERLREILAPKLSKENLDQFIRAVRSRGGLFEERAELFQFAHLTFQEFLAARLLAKDREKSLPILEERIPDA
ncbi:NACHT domain-containing protein, partial [candidate division KSB1 bacterium]|nr:NACHT domain-containing protein [candidate division KSB1 bacterium]